MRRNWTTRPISAKSLALAVDRAVRKAKMADWRGHPIKERRIGAAIQAALGPYKALTFTVFEIVKKQREY